MVMEAWMARALALAEKSAQDNHSKIADDDRHQLTDNSATKSNELARAHYRFNLPEKRCMEAMVSKLNPASLNEFQTQDIELKATDYAKAFGISEKSAYREMSNALDALQKRIITTREDFKGRPAVVKRPLIFRGVYEDGKGKITASFHPDFIPHLIGLREKFTSYPLQKAVNFSSSYTWRLYEIMCSWSQDKKITSGVFLGWFTVSVDELRQQMGMPESYLWVNVERTLTKATDELWEKARIKTVITRTKTSRKITHLKFEFCEDQQQPLL
jgi:plasmid replication initiation protein